MNLMKFTFASLCITLLFASHAFGAATLSFNPSISTLTSEGGTVNFTISVDGEAGDVLQAIDAYMTLSGPNVVNISNETNLFGFPLFNQPPPGVSDFAIAGAGFDPVSVEGPTDIFSFDATFAPNLTAVDQVYDFAFDPSNINWSVRQSFGDSLDVSLSGASVTISAVPEPSGLAVLSLLSFGVMVRFRKRSKRTK